MMPRATHTRSPVRSIPAFTLDGVRDARITYHPVSTSDGLGLHLFRFHRADTRNVVLLSHGLTTSTDMFIMPEHRNLVSYLLDNGFTDVWSFDWRGSMRHTWNVFPHRYTLDDVAARDYPAALDVIRAHTAPDVNIHAIVHCVGSLTFFMSLLGGSIDNIASVTSNSVSLIARVPPMSWFKLHAAPFFVEYLLRLPHMNPRWQNLPGPAAGKLLARLVTLLHRECDSPECHMISVMWGQGRPACYEHRNLDPRTHERLGDLFGATSMHYLRHIRKLVDHGFLRSYDGGRSHAGAAPGGDYASGIGRLNMPIFFLTGRNNRVFLDSNCRAYSYLAEHGGHDRSRLFIVPDYGHQDIFMGKNADRDVFPHILSFLRQAIH